MKCVHCGGGHGLEVCPEISDDQLNELLVHLSGAQQGQMIFQDDDSKDSLLNRDYLYLNTCCTEDQMIDGLVGNVGDMLACVAMMPTLLAKNWPMTNVANAVTRLIAGPCVG